MPHSKILKILLGICFILVMSICRAKASDISVFLGARETVSFSEIEGIPSELSWSADSDCILLSEDGSSFTGVKPGSAALIGRDDSGLCIQLTATVKNGPKGVHFAMERDCFGVGEEILPSIEMNKDSASFHVKYGSKTPSIVSVVVGQLTAEAVGDAKITAILYNGKNDTKSVHILPSPDSISFDKEEYLVGQDEFFSPLCMPNKGTSGAIFYTSENPEIVSIDSQTGLAHAQSIGQTRIFALSYNGCKTECKVLVCPQPEAITIEVPGGLLGQGETGYPVIRFYPEGSGGGVSLQADNTSVLTIGPDLSVTGIKRQKVILSATAYNGLKAETELTVCGVPKEVISTVSRNKLAVEDCETIILSFPKQTGGGCTFTSSHPEIASVDRHGFIQALKPGKTVIRTEAYNGIRDTLTITVADIPNEISIPEQLNMRVGQELVLPYAFPTNTLSRVSFLSDHPEIVSVNDQTGLLQAIQEGTAEIRITAVNSGATAFCQVSVKPLPDHFWLADDHLTLCSGEVYEIALSFSPENSWSELSGQSENPAIVSCVSGMLIGGQEGQTTVRIYTANGLCDTMEITVLPGPASLMLDTEYAEISPGETYTLNAATEDGSFTHFHYSSSDNSVAEIDNKTGFVIGKKAGTAILTVKTDNGLEKKSIVNVINPDDSSTQDLSDILSVTFLSIGRNDGIFLECGGECAFIDSGVRKYGLQAVDYLKDQSVDHLKYYIGTHAHQDHVGGAPAILSAMDTDCVIIPHSKVQAQIQKYATTDTEKYSSGNALYHIMAPGDTLYLGSSRITCLGPIHLLDIKPTKNDENYNSLILRVSFGNISFLLGADGMYTEFAEIESAFPGSLKCNVMKTPHHFADQPVQFIQWTQPEITVFSTDDISLPIFQYTENLKKAGSVVYCTAPSRDGTVTISTDGFTISAETENGW